MSDSTIDWRAFREAIAGVAVADDPEVLKLKSRDFYWYSPILVERLDAVRADLVVTPASEDEVLRVLAAAARVGAPVTVRGAGTGNYGQAMPLAGGVVLETTKLNRVLGVGEGWLRAEAGARLEGVDRAARETQQELLMWPSTKRSATLGGFVAGGSAGIGSLRHGMLKDAGVLRRVRVATCEPAPRVLELAGADILQVHHAYGTNGVILDLEVALAPSEDWVQCLTTTPTYADAMRLAKLVGASELAVHCLSTVESRVVPYLKPLRDKLPAGRSFVVAIVARRSLAEYERLAIEHRGEQAFAGDDAELRRHGLPSLSEFTYNHVTLQALKVDKSVTYLQVLFPPPIDVDAIESLARHFGDELLWHHELVRAAGALVAFAIPIVRYTGRERLETVIAELEARGFPVFNPHTYVMEDGGMKQVDPRHIAFKRVADPQGLLNPGKTRGWDGPGPRPVAPN
ncbi:MAG: FAD-binding oxidoreductase [Lacipirellulaceae bacterium]